MLLLSTYYLKKSYRMSLLPLFPLQPGSLMRGNLSSLHYRSYCFPAKSSSFPNQIVLVLFLWSYISSSFKLRLGWLYSLLLLPDLHHITLLQQVFLFTAPFHLNLKELSSCQLFLPVFIPRPCVLVSFGTNAFIISCFICKPSPFLIYHF